MIFGKNNDECIAMDYSPYNGDVLNASFSWWILKQAKKHNAIEVEYV